MNLEFESWFSQKRLAFAYAVMYFYLMATNSINISRSALNKAIRQKRLRQSDIAMGVCASQSQVSRVLSGETSERSRLYGQICNFVSGRHRLVKRQDVQQCAELIDALMEVWDGTNEQARSLALVIRGLSLLTRRT